MTANNLLLPRTRGGFAFADFTEDMWKSYALNMDASDADSAARSPYAPEFIIEQCAVFPEAAPRAAVARRSDVSRFAKTLSRDKDADVLEGLAANRWAPRWLLGDLIRHGSPLVAEIAARNPAAPSDEVDAYLLRKYSQ